MLDERLMTPEQNDIVKSIKIEVAHLDMLQRQIEATDLTHSLRVEKDAMMVSFRNKPEDYIVEVLKRLGFTQVEDKPMKFVKKSKGDVFVSRRFR